MASLGSALPSSLQCASRSPSPCLPGASPTIKARFCSSFTCPPSFLGLRRHEGRIFLHRRFHSPRPESAPALHCRRRCIAAPFVQRLLSTSASMSEVPQERLGLYDPALDRDSCGVGFVAEISAVPSRRIVRSSLPLATAFAIFLRLSVCQNLLLLHRFWMH